MSKNLKRTIYFIIGIFIFCFGFNVILALSNSGESVNDYTIKYSYNIREDGWYDTFKIYIWNNGEYNYVFNGYNLKYDRLDEYYIPVINGDTGEITDKIIPPAPSLSSSESLRNDVEKINEYFNSYDFKESITLDNLKDLDISNIDKEYVLKLFNDAISSKEINKKGKYIDKQVINKIIRKSTGNINGEYILSYTIDYGYVSNIYMDIKLNDGNFLKSKEIYSNDEKQILELFNLIQDSLLEDVNKSSSNILKSKTFGLMLKKEEANDIEKIINDFYKSLQ